MTDEHHDESPEFERPRRPHWRRRSFWKTFLIFLVVYAVIRIGVTVALDLANDRDDSDGVVPDAQSPVADAPPAPASSLPAGAGDASR